MAVRFEKNERRSAPGTRLYVPSRDSSAYAVDPETGETTEEFSAQDDATRPVPISVRREMSTIERIGIMFCGFVFAGMIVFILSGYERISRAYADINTLNNDIEQVELHISELNVSIECAVTIDDAQAAALAAGMQYPTQSQYVKAGDRIPETADGPTGDAPDANSDGDTAPGDGDAPTGDTPEGDTKQTP